MRAENQTAALIGQAMESELLVFSPAWLRSEQTEAKFQGRGEEPFMVAASMCLQPFVFEASSHSLVLMTPSENSEVFDVLPGEQAGSDDLAISCFVGKSADDFYVTRAANASLEGQVGGEQIMAGQ